MARKKQNRTKSKPAAAAAGGRQYERTGKGFRRTIAFTQRTADYAATLADPRHHSGARIPIPPMVPSATISSSVRVQFTTSSLTGFGYVIANPFHGVCNNNTGAEPLFVSAAAYAGGFAFDTATAPLPTGYNTNSPFTLNQFAYTKAGGLKYRLVSANIVISYAGTELNRGGTYIAICDPAGGNLISATAAFLSGIPGVNDRRITERDVSVNWCPCDPDDFEYKQAPATDGYSCMGILIQSSVVSTAFVAELTCNYEVVGQGASGYTPIAPDTDGALAVAAAAASMHVGGQTGSSMETKGIMSRAASAILDTTSAVLTGVVEGVGGAAGVGKMIGNYVVGGPNFSSRPLIKEL